MKRAGRIGLAILVGAAATAALGALSQAPYAPREAQQSLLRLAWRLRGSPVTECRRLSPDELARLPAHMRRAEECTRGVAPYRLDVRIDGRPAIDELVHAAGARQDRPLYVHHEVPLAPGEHVVEVTFLPADPESGAVAPDDRRAPVRLALRSLLTLGPGDVALVTYDADSGALVVKRHR